MSIATLCGVCAAHGAAQSSDFFAHGAASANHPKKGRPKHTTVDGQIFAQFGWKLSRNYAKITRKNETPPPPKIGRGAKCRGQFCAPPVSRFSMQFWRSFQPDRANTCPPTAFWQVRANHRVPNSLSTPRNVHTSCVTQHTPTVQEHSEEAAGPLWHYYGLLSLSDPLSRHSK